MVLSWHFGIGENQKFKPYLKVFFVIGVPRWADFVRSNFVFMVGFGVTFSCSYPQFFRSGTSGENRENRKI